MTISEDRGHRFEALLAQLVAQQQEHQQLPQQPQLHLPPSDAQQGAVEPLAAGPAITQPTATNAVAYQAATAAGQNCTAALQQQLER